jgi:competence protein ComEC
MGGGMLLRLVGGPDGLARGDQIAFVVQLGPVTAAHQLELTNPLPRLSSRGVVASGGALAVELERRGEGILARIDRVRAHVRRRILATYAPRAAALGRALVLGENDLDSDEQLAFQRSGLSHLLAVSGTHLVFAVASLVAGLRALLLRIPWLARRVDVRRLSSAFGILLSLVYADFAGGSGSAFRAAYMLSATYLAVALGRRLRGIHALAYSLLIGAIFDPLIGYDVSFLLSAAATSGLILLGPFLSSGLGRIRPAPIRGLIGALTTTVSAMLPCLPLLLLLGPEITIAGILANVVAGPIGELLALPLCLLHAVAAPLPWLERGLSLAGSGALLAVGYVAKLSANVEWARVALPPPTVPQLACLIVCAMTWYGGFGASDGAASGVRRPRVVQATLLIASATALAVLEWTARREGAPHDKLRITAVDVGQGDALLIDLPDGRLMLVDGGGAVTGGPDPGQSILAPLLRARRRARIDVAVLTHPHPDHYGGLSTLLRTLDVGEFWEAGQSRGPSDQGELAQLRRYLERSATRIRRLPELCETQHRFASATVEVMGPCPNYDPTHDANDQSIVLRISMGSRVALLPGDAEALEESELIVQHGGRLRADFLKVGHHGSRSSTSAPFLESVRPAIAVISAGMRNRFGHPHPNTLRHLDAANVTVYRTDELGGIQWTTDGQSVELRTAHYRVHRGAFLSR